MKEWVFGDLSSIKITLISVISVFSVIILYTRIFGLRTFSKMSSFDFASTIAIGSIIASVITNSKLSIVRGAVALGAIILFQYIFTFVTKRFKIFNKILTNKPQVLMYEGEILYKQLDKTHISEADLIAKLREANVIDFEEVLAVVLESTGDISVLHSCDKKSLDPRLLNGVSELYQKI